MSKRVNVNRGLKLHTGDWDEAFCYVRGQQFGIRGEFTDDEAQAAFKLCENGASPMQAAIELYGPRGRFARQVQGTRRALELVSEIDPLEYAEEIAKAKREGKIN